VRRRERVSRKTDRIAPAPAELLHIRGIASVYRCPGFALSRQAPVPLLHEYSCMEPHAITHAPTSIDRLFHEFGCGTIAA
jgi:hypothetical protein